MSPHLVALLLLLMPQAPPVNVTINVQIDNVFIGVPTPTPPTPAGEIVNTPSCVDLMASYLAAGGMADPFERATEAEFRGGDQAYADNHGCMLQASAPGP